MLVALFFRFTRKCDSENEYICMGEQFGIQDPWGSQESSLCYWRGTERDESVGNLGKVLGSTEDGERQIHHSKKMIHHFACNDALEMKEMKFKVLSRLRLIVYMIL